MSIFSKKKPDQTPEQEHSDDAAEGASGGLANKLKDEFETIEKNLLDKIEDPAKQAFDKAKDSIEFDLMEGETAVKEAGDHVKTAEETAGSTLKDELEIVEEALDQLDTGEQSAPSHKSPLSRYRDLQFAQASVNLASTPKEGAPAVGGGPTSPPVGTPSLNDTATQSVQFSNAETAGYAPAMITTPTDQMIGQAAGLAAQASAQYFDSMTKVVMAAQSVIVKKLAQDVADGNEGEAALDGLVLAETEILLAGAMAVAAAGGAMEAEAASFGISKINSSLSGKKAP
ncbi:hypothetical protein [uncultured Ruegeria sp.]|uniref:hypothetical protein n=1 Tax=uncultured Ruegeria sp. TaxID=259304 RepID=UPI00260832F9|nr:hypothetical protein [uncultured Ruegeria sp.]